jgi:TonB family protein
MATLSEVGTDPVAQELDLLLHWQKRHSARGWLGIAVASVLLNLLFMLVVVQAPGSVSPAPQQRTVVIRKIRLYTPRDLLTQKAPNTRTPTKNIDLKDLLPVAPSRARNARPNPSVRHFEAPSSLPPRQTAKAAPQIMAEAPNVPVSQAPSNLPPGAANGLTAAVPPPPTPPDQPFQNVGSEPLTNHPKLAVPKTGVQSAIQSLAQPPNSTRLTINDDNQSQPSPAAPGTNGQAPAQHAQVELQSDPQGADFRNYLAHVLSIVRANWRHVIPESVRMGTLRGRTVVEFIISRDGSIPKLVTADPSGSDALDRAAIAGLSMSNPLPPLPVDFKGMQVRLAFTFSYNMPSSQ